MIQFRVEVENLSSREVDNISLSLVKVVTYFV